MLDAPVTVGPFVKYNQPVREAVSYRGLFTAGWFGVREKHCSRLKIYDHLRASEQAVNAKPRQPLCGAPLPRALSSMQSTCTSSHAQRAR